MAAAASTVTTDMLVDVVDADHVLLEETLTEHDQHFSPWTLHVPDNATVVEAHDAQGFLGNVTNADGTVTIKTPNRNVPLPYGFTVTFAKAPEGYGALRSVFAGVGNAGGASTLHVRLPAGWTLVGEQAQPAMQPDAQGIYTAQEAFGATFAYLPPGVADAGPDGRVTGEGVLREGVANLTASGGTLTLTMTYDTGIYGTVSTLVPAGATLIEARTAFGPTASRLVDGDAEIAHPYPFGAGLGARPVTLRFQLPAPVPFGGAFLNQSLNMPAGEGDTVTLVVNLAPGLTHVATRTRAATDATGLRMSAHAPFVADVAMLPPLPAGSTDFDAGIYHVRVPDSLAAQARAVALNATEQLARTSAFARGDHVDTPFYLTYSDDESIFALFSGEEGFYSSGLDTISIRASDLANTTATRVDFPALSTLVHETTHGLVDRLVPEGYGNLSFFQEGLARLAENHLEVLFPDQVVKTTPTGWTRLSVRPDAGEVQSRYQSRAAFPLTWNAERAGSDIGWLYDDSGLILRAYEERSDADALGRALVHLALRGPGPTDDAEAQAVVDAMLNESAGMTAASLLYPGATVASLPAGSFAACMGDLVAPPFPSDPLPARPKDCGDAPAARGVGTFSADAGPVPAHGENFTLPTAPPPTASPVQPTAGSGPTPVPVPTAETPPTDGGGPTPTSAGGDETSPIPFPALPLVVALVAAAAVLARRRS
jgi:hypothetical protein